MITICAGSWNRLPHMSMSSMQSGVSNIYSQSEAASYLPSLPLDNLAQVQGDNQEVASNLILNQHNSELICIYYPTNPLSAAVSRLCIC